MAAIVLPNRSRFAIARREPNLLAPGRKPVGAVELNEQHHLYHHVRWSFIFQNVGDGFDHATKQVYPQVGSLRGVNQHGGYIHSPSYGGANYQQAPATDCSGWAGVSVVALCVADFSLGDYYPALAASVDTGNYYGNFLLSADGSGVQKFRFRAGNSATLCETGVITNLDHTFVAGTWDKSTLRAYSAVNGGGLTVGTTAAQTTGFIGAAQENYVGYYSRSGGRSYRQPIYAVLVFDRALSIDELDYLRRDLYALYRPANQSPFLISIPGGGGAAYDETFSASSASALALSDSWALSYAETFGASAASGAEFTDSYQTPSANYDETFAASAASGAELTDAWALDYSETFAATAASGATLTDAWLLNYAETFAAASAAAFTLTDAWALDYAETFAASAASGCDLTHSYAVGNNYAETFAASSVSVATLTHAYSVQYAETFAAQALADCALVATWALDYAETFAASSAADCVLTDAYGTPAPGAFDETFAAAAVSACDLTHAFSTPAAIGRVINPTLAASGVPARTLKGLKLIN